MIKIGFKKLRKDAVLPVKAHESDSGFDLVAVEDVIIEPGQTVIVPIGIAIQLPEGYEAQVRPRSGITSKTKLRVQLGTIDQGYTGEIGVIVDNLFVNINDMKSEFYFTTDAEEIHTKYLGRIHIGDMYVDEHEQVKHGTYKIHKGDRIAQLVIQELPKVVATEIQDLEETERGSNGYGSSGTKSVYVAQLDSEKQKKIKQALEEAIKETGLYSEKEVAEHVNRAMDSKITDLEDIIDIFKFI